jgi:hypothetical protein
MRFHNSQNLFEKFSQKSQPSITYERSAEFYLSGILNFLIYITSYGLS